MDRMNMGSLEETRQGDREIQGEVTGQCRPRSPKLVQSAEGGPVLHSRISGGEHPPVFAVLGRTLYEARRHRGRDAKGQKQH